MRNQNKKLEDKAVGSQGRAGGSRKKILSPITAEKEEEVSANMKVVPHGGFPMWLIKPEGKGSVHKSLRGMYTTKGKAEDAIAFYLKEK